MWRHRLFSTLFVDFQQGSNVHQDLDYFKKFLIFFFLPFFSMKDCYEIEINIFSVQNINLQKVCCSIWLFFPTKGEKNLFLGCGSYVGYPSTMRRLNEWNLLFRINWGPRFNVWDCCSRDRQHHFTIIIGIDWFHFQSWIHTFFYKQLHFQFQTWSCLAFKSTGLETQGSPSANICLNDFSEWVFSVHLQISM